MKLSEAANRVIDLARKVRDYYAAELPKWHPNYPLVQPDEKEGPAPPEETDLRDFLNSLPHDQVYQLALIMYLGRGDFDTNDLPANYEALKTTFSDPKHAASQMMEKAPLADYLEDGIRELREHKIKVDKLPLK
jgi:hypothetical protein